MLPWLLYPFRDLVPGFSVFRYVTFRSAMAAATAMVLSLLLGPWVIRTPDSSQDGSARPRRGPREPPEKGWHTDHGGYPHPDRHHRVHAALVRPQERRHLGGPHGPAGLRYGRRLRRCAEAPQEAEPRSRQLAEDGPAHGHLPDRRLAHPAFWSEGCGDEPALSNPSSRTSDPMSVSS